jgi:hypothetical protein
VKRHRRTAVDEPKGKPSWLDWAIIIALVVALVIAALLILGQQTSMFNFVNKNL